MEADIAQYDLDHFIDGNLNLLEKHKPHSWPTYYKNTIELKELLFKEQYKYYVIFSSYGLNGWVLAKQMKILKSNA